MDKGQGATTSIIVTSKSIPNTVLRIYNLHLHCTAKTAPFMFATTLSDLFTLE